jgi:hypothetical protein
MLFSYDGLFDAVGSLGPFQLLFYTLYCIPVNFFGSQAQWLKIRGYGDIRLDSFTKAIVCRRSSDKLVFGWLPTRHEGAFVKPW